MNKKNIALVLPLALLLSACTTPVTPAFKDIGSRNGPCVEGGPDQVAEQFYNLRVQQMGAAGTASANYSAEQLRPFLSQALYQDIQKARQTQSANRSTTHADQAIASVYAGVSDADVASASTIPNTDAKNIPLRVTLVHRAPDGKESRWQDEVLMVREGSCWVVDDIRFMGANAPASSLRQLLGQR
ncbi:lipoprotein [Yersinia entomophaga]|uniref:Lipoprotein n=1 Tax=Yersinia entomophaga TaxID=935293 RepID=A0ABM6BGX0_YERET|nr:MULTISPECIES: lipoprotein [Yersinia]ANI28697.1 lipoprotein [Yersinia entomophaga]OWF89764.1 lipoprotein [Yersinia entomophaga]